MRINAEGALLTPSPPDTMPERAPALTIDSVEVARHGAICEGRLTTPEIGDSRTTYPLFLSGWVVGASSRVTEVEVRCAGVVQARIGVATPCPEASELCPDLSWAGHSGFEGTVNGARLPDRFCLDLFALVDDGTRLTLGSVHGKRHGAPYPPVGALQPIMLTTLGRSGSTWVTRLLGQHPEIATYGPFRFEPRAASYWMEVYGALTHPESYQQILAGELYGPEWWTGNRRSEVCAPKAGTLEEWLGTAQADALLPFCQERIEAFYREAAHLEKKGGTVKLFCEKFTTNSFVQPLLAGMYPGAREIVLVRDFRDMICSMFSYNEKRGHVGFGRDQVETDEEFVRWWQGGVEQLLHEWKARSETAYLLRYEDLVLAPRETLRALLEYLGVASEAPEIDELIRRATELTPRAQKLHSTTSDAAVSVGRWKTDLDPSLSTAAEEAFGESLRELRYEA